MFTHHENIPFSIEFYKFNIDGNDLYYFHLALISAHFICFDFWKNILLTCDTISKAETVKKRNIMWWSSRYEQGICTLSKHAAES